MKHYYRVIFCYPDGVEEISDEKHETEIEAIYEGEEGIEGFSAGGDVLALAGKDYISGSAEFDIEECYEDDEGDITKSTRWRPY